MDRTSDSDSYLGENLPLDSPGGSQRAGRVELADAITAEIWANVLNFVPGTDFTYWYSSLPRA